jgi:hypothetical protein
MRHYTIYGVRIGERDGEGRLSQSKKGEERKGRGWGYECEIDYNYSYVRERRMRMGGQRTAGANSALEERRGDGWGRRSHWRGVSDYLNVSYWNRMESRF